MKLPTVNVPAVGQISGIKGIVGLILGIVVLLFAFYAGSWIWKKLHSTTQPASTSLEGILPD